MDFKGCNIISIVVTNNDPVLKFFGTLFSEEVKLCHCFVNRFIVVCCININTREGYYKIQLKQIAYTVRRKNQHFGRKENILLIH